MRKETLRTKALKRIQFLNDSQKLNAGNLPITQYDLIIVMDTKGFQTAIIKTTFGFILMQTKTKRTDIMEIWLTDSEFRIMMDAKCRKITIETVERQLINPKDIDLETYT